MTRMCLFVVVVWFSGFVGGMRGWIGYCSSPLVGCLPAFTTELRYLLYHFLSFIAKIVIDFAEAPYAKKLGRWYSVVPCCWQDDDWKGWVWECDGLLCTLLNGSFKGKVPGRAMEFLKIPYVLLNVYCVDATSSCEEELPSIRSFHQRYRPLLPHLNYKQLLFSL